MSCLTERSGLENKKLGRTCHKNSSKLIRSWKKNHRWQSTRTNPHKVDPVKFGKTIKSGCPETQWRTWRRRGEREENEKKRRHRLGNSVKSQTGRNGNFMASVSRVYIPRKKSRRSAGVNMAHHEAKEGLNSVEFPSLYQIIVRNLTIHIEVDRITSFCRFFL